MRDEAAAHSADELSDDAVPDVVVVLGAELAVDHFSDLVREADVLGDQLGQVGAVALVTRSAQCPPGRRSSPRSGRCRAASTTTKSSSGTALPAVTRTRGRI